jgi:hypothetical protein
MKVIFTFGDGLELRKREMLMKRGGVRRGCITYLNEICSHYKLLSGCSQLALQLLFFHIAAGIIVMGGWKRRREGIGGAVEGKGSIY